MMAEPARPRRNGVTNRPTGGSKPMTIGLWRCGESNPGPLSHLRRHLRAQPSASFRSGGVLMAQSPPAYPGLSLPAGPGPRRMHPAKRRPIPTVQEPTGRTGCY